MKTFYRMLGICIVFFISINILSNCKVSDGAANETANAKMENKKNIEKQKKIKNAKNSVANDNKLLVYTEKATILKNKEITIHLSGDLLPKENIIFGPKESGIAEKIHFNLGDKVYKGKVLVSMSDHGLSSAKVKMENSLRQFRDLLGIKGNGSRVVISDNSLYGNKIKLQRQALDIAKREYKRLNRLVGSGAIESQKVDSASDQYKIASTQLNLTHKEFQNKVLEYKTLLKDYEELLKRVSYLTVKSPINGKIADKFVNVGERVLPAPQGRVARIIDDSILKLTVGVPEQYYHVVDIRNTKVDINLPGQVENYKAKIAYISPLIDKSTRSFKVEIHLKNNKKSIKAGLFVDSTLKTYKNGMFIPAKSVLKEATGDFVYIHVDGKAKANKVITGLTVNKEIEILSGIDEQDEVIINPPDTIKDGSLVEVKSVNRS